MISSDSGHTVFKSFEFPMKGRNGFHGLGISYEAI
jgi:hypothetical protein